MHQKVFRAFISSPGTKQTEDNSSQHVTDSENKQHVSSLQSPWLQIKCTINSFSSVSLYLVKYFSSCYCTQATGALFKPIWFYTAGSPPWLRLRSHCRPTLCDPCAGLSESPRANATCRTGQCSSAHFYLLIQNALHNTQVTQPRQQIKTKINNSHLAYLWACNSNITMSNNYMQMLNFYPIINVVNTILIFEMILVCKQRSG